MIASLLLATAFAITPQEAKALPVPELAQRVLGAAGTMVTDVDRPDWPTCFGFCPAQVPHPEGPPPLNTLTFYTRASASIEGGWLGLCRATAIDVSFDASGVVTSLNQRTTVGWLGALTRTKTGDGPAGVAALSAQLSDFEARCRTLTTTKHFISAFDPLGGERSFIAVSLVHDSMMKGGPIRVTCAIELFSHQPCGTASDLRTFAKDVTAEKITGVEQVDPRTGQFVSDWSAERACYAIRLAQSFGVSDQINICVRVSDTLTVTRAAFSRSRVVY
jgi:hypothetical protein